MKKIVLSIALLGTILSINAQEHEIINGNLTVNGNLTKIGGNVRGAVLRIEATDEAGAPARAVGIELHGYEGRGKGLYISDKNTSNKWFIGEGYNYSGIGIGFNTVDRTEYLENVKFLINSNGNVGIGTTSPSAPLAIVAENWQEGPAIPKVLSVADPSDETKTISIGYDKNNDAGVIASVDGGTGWKNTLIQPYGGNVGMGTLDPDEKLDVNGKIQSDYLIVNAYNSTEGGEIRLDGPDSFNDWRLDNSSGHFRLHHSGVEYLRLEPDGHLGIGTNNPEEKLSVNGTATIMGDIGITTQPHWRTGSHTLELQNIDAGDVVLSFHRAGHSNASIKHSVLGDLIFAGNGAHDSKHLVLKRNGHIGIGTDDTKGFELGVKGKIAAEEVKVAIYPWPDFVFKSDYNLPTLKEVEQHIKDKGHLKDIPSAKEVEADGIFLGDMNSKLLQKIEELTLYTIAQQKEIDRLKTLETQNALQEQRIDKLEKLIIELSKSVNKE